MAMMVTQPLDGLTAKGSCQESDLLVFNAMVAICCRDGPSQLLSQPDDNIWELDSSQVDVAEALQHLITLVPRGCGIHPGVNCAGLFAASSRPQLPTGKEIHFCLPQIVGSAYHGVSQQQG